MTLLSRRVLHDGRVGAFGIDEVEMPSGRHTTLEVLRHPGAAAAVVLTDSDDVVLLRQYRHAVGIWLWEIPAGKLDPGESPLACIEREIEEETGLRARSIEGVGEIVTAPGFSDERIHLFVAREVEPGTMAHDADEEIEVHTVPFADALAMIGRGEIIDAKSIVALYLCDQRLRR